MTASAPTPRLSAAVILLVIVEANFLYQYGYLSQNLLQVDLPTFWAAARLTFAEGRSPYDYDAMLGHGATVGRHVFPFLYPPTGLLPLFPLGLVTWARAASVVAAANHLLALGCVALILKLLARYSNRPGLEILGVFLGACLVVGMPVVNTIVHGQSNLLVLALLCVVWLGLRRRWEAAAGAALALAILLKPTPAIFLLYLAARRSWRALGVCVASLAAATIASVGILPDGVWTAWLSEVRPSLGYGVQPVHLFSPACPSNQSLNGLVARLYLEPTCLPIDAGVPPRGRLMLYAASAALLALSTWAVWRAHATLAAKRGRAGALCLLPPVETEDLGFCVFLATMFLTASLSWEHHLVFVLPALALLFGIAVRATAPGRTVCGLAIVAPGILVTLPLDHPALRDGLLTGLGSVRTWAVLLLWSILLLRLLRAVRPHPSRTPATCPSHTH